MWAGVTSSSQRSICGLSIGNFQSPQQELKAPLWKPLLAPVEGFQPLHILHIQVILYEALIKVAHTTCASATLWLNHIVCMMSGLHRLASV